MSIGKVVKKVTSILLIVAMIMTSAGIQTFAGSIDDVVNEAKNEKIEENLNRKYYDGLVDPQENSTEEKFENEGENNSQDKVEEKEKKNSEEKGSDDGAEEPEEESSNDGYEEEPEEDETTKASNEEPEEDKTTVDPSEESKDSDEEKESDKKESEESSSVSDTDNDDKKIEEEKVATESETSDDADTTEEANNEKEEDEIDKATVSEIYYDEELKEATASEMEEIVEADVATESEVEIATDSKISIKNAKELVATNSSLDNIFGWSGTVGRNIPSITVWGDVGYRGGSDWLNKGYFHYLLYRENDQHKVTFQKELKNPEIPADLRYFVWTTGNRRVISNIWNSFIVTGHGRSDEYPLDDWQNINYAMNKGGITSNIKGYVYSEDRNVFNPVDGVTFNNEWEQDIRQAEFNYHLDAKDKQSYYESVVGGIAKDLSGTGTSWPKGTFKSRFQGMYVTAADQERRVRWENDGWKDNDFTHILKGHIHGYDKNNAEKQKEYLKNQYEASIKGRSKNISYSDGKKKYRLIGWTNMYHFKNPDWKQWGGKGLYSAIQPFINDDAPVVTSDGMKIWYVDAWDAVSFGPNYRSGSNGAWREGYRFGMMDQGVMLATGESKDGAQKDDDQWKGGSGPWSGITFTSRKGHETGDEIENSSLKYRVDFMSPVFEEVDDMTISFDLQKGSWIQGYNPPTNYDSASTTALPDGTKVTREGYSFIGWYTKASGGDKITSLGRTEAKQGIRKLYAQWAGTKYKITIQNTTRTVKINGVNKVLGNNNVLKSFDAEYDDSFYMPSQNGKVIGEEGWLTAANVFEIDGFDFLGFSQDKNATEPKWKSYWSCYVKTLELDASGNVYIYPVYKEKTYKLTLDGGTVTASDGKDKKSDYKKEIECSYYGSFKLPTPDELTGFNFKGWKLFSFGWNEVILSPGNTNYNFKDYYEDHFYWDKTITAVWEEKEYPVEFKGGKIKASDNKEYTSSGSKATTNYKYYDSIDLPTDFAIEDFTLVGFGTTNGGTTTAIKAGTSILVNDINSFLSETATTTFYGVWKEKEVTIGFNGGSKIASDNIRKESSSKVETKYGYKSKVTIPNATLDGFNLKGYNKVNESNTVTLGLDVDKTAKEFVTTYGATEDKITFYGVWEEKQYLLEINAGSKVLNGKTYVGEGTIATRSYGYYSNVSMPNTMTMRGFKLVGFSKADRQDTAKYSVDDVVEVTELISYVPMSEYTETNKAANKLYAVWEAASATIKFDAVGGLFLNGRREKTLKVDKIGDALNEYTGYEEPVSSDEYEFSHWEDAEGNKYTGESKISGDLSLVAKYVTKTIEEVNNTLYTINVSNDNAKGTYTGPVSFNVMLGSNVLASMSEAGVTNPVANTRYTFVGWSFDGGKVIDDTYVYADNTKNTIYAVYSENTIKIELSAKTGQFKNGEKIVTIISTESKALNTYDKYEEPTKDEWTFKRWLDGSVEVASTSIMTSDITLVAEYVKDASPSEVEPITTYNIMIFNDDSKGTFTGTDVLPLAFGSNILASMSEVGINEPIAKEGWNFLGWSWTENDEDNLIKATDRYVNISLNRIYAVYSKVTYTVVLSADDGTFENGLNTKTITSDNKIALNSFTGYEEPTKANYEFIRWVDSTNVEIASTSIISSNTTLIARYKAIPADVTDGKFTINIDNDATKGDIKVNGVVQDSARFKIALNDDILVTLANEGITAEAKPGYIFKGWSWTGDIDSIINAGDKYTDSKYTNLKAVYTNIGEYTVVLKANTGVFESNKLRKLTIKTDNTSIKVLKDVTGYEIPKKANATFDRWIKNDGSVFAATSSVVSDLVLTAIYKDDSTGGDIGLPGSGTEDGGTNATYTVYLKNEAKKGTMSNATRKAIGGEEYDVALIEIKNGDGILNKIDENGITITPDSRYIFDGWSKSTDPSDMIVDSDTYDDSDLTEIYTLYYLVLDIRVKLNANTGLFRNNTRIKEMTSTRKIELQDFVNYEEPEKTDGYTFNRWEDSTGKKIELTHEFGTESDGKVVELFAIYLDGKENTVGKGETKDGGPRANYTVRTKYDPTKASVSNTSFEVKKDGLVKQAMIDYDAYNPTKEADGWWQKGWSFDNSLAHLVDDTTTYTDTDKTLIYAQYLNVNEWTLVLKANTGLFGDNTREKTLTNPKRVDINSFTGYEKPVKSNGYKFDRWEDATGKVFKETDKPDEPLQVLYAIYKDDKNNDIGKGDTQEGNSDASYTIRLSSDNTKGILGTVTLFDIKLGNYILASMSEAGVTDPTTIGDNYFVGWSWVKDSYIDAVTKTNIFKGNEGTVLHALYSNELISVKLRANTGVFDSNASREKNLQVPKYKLLKDASGYEEPVKTDATFNRWLRSDGTGIGSIDTFTIEQTETLDAIYASASNVNIGKDDDKDGEENATYTIKVVNNDLHGTYTGAKYFEIRKGEVIYTTMKAAGVTEGVGKTGYLFKGWNLGGNLISALTTYEDTTLAEMVLEYTNLSTNLTFDGDIGRFSDGSQFKEYVVARGRYINTIEGYEEPTKENWTFTRWIDEAGREVASASQIPDEALSLTLTARYKNASGQEFDVNGHAHLECGADHDNASSHATTLIPSHDEKIAYLPIANSKELFHYIDDEIAKRALDRSAIKVYLENDVALDRDIVLGLNMNLYICLNGHILRGGKIGYGNEGRIVICNCQDQVAQIVEDKTVSTLNAPFFGAGDVSILSAKGKIKVVSAGRLAEVVGTMSTITRNFELMNVEVSKDSAVEVDRLIYAEGNSTIRLSNVRFENIKVKDSIVTTVDDAELFVDSEVDFENNLTNKSLLDIEDTFEIVDAATLSIINNTIEKNKNGDTALVFIRDSRNQIDGNFIVTGNKLVLEDAYKKLVKPERPKEDKKASESSFNKEYGRIRDEGVLTGDIGYSAAVAFTSDDIGLNVGNAKIKIYGNTSDDKYDEVSYMYQVKAKNNESGAIINQEIGTALSGDSIIGVSFDTEDGEGLLSSGVANKDIFRINTYGKEEKLLNIKENEGNLELLRKIYYVEYDEGAPTTNESKKVITSYKADGSTISETTRIKTLAMKAGHDVRLENDDIYRTKGFDLATYSIISKDGRVLGNFKPKATISYLDDIFDDEAGIDDGEVIKAKALWNEKEITSEARNFVISKEDYDKMLHSAATTVANTIASASAASQEEEVEEGNTYTVRYYLNGGHIEGHEIDESEYFDVTGINRKDKYTLINVVDKVATESGVVLNYDFTGWFTTPIENVNKTDEDPIESIEAGYEGEDIYKVYASYLPSAYKITYHLEGGSIEGYSGEDIVDTIARTTDYTLLKGVKKAEQVFTRWVVVYEDSGSDFVVEDGVIKANALDGNLEAYADYETALYDVTYNLNGGVIKGITSEGDTIYVDNTANILKDYFLYNEVNKKGYKFTGWKTEKGKTIDKIAAGDADSDKRSVTAEYTPITWTIIYDTDDGRIVGTEGGTVTEKVDEGQDYTLYTNVEKEGWDFAFWFDINTYQRVDTIKGAKAGAVYNVRAAYDPIDYSLNLHLDEDNVRVIDNISYKSRYILPTDVEKENHEFVNWYYKDSNGRKVTIEYIDEKNPNNITDVYANFDNLMTQKVVYHLLKGETIVEEDVDEAVPYNGDIILGKQVVVVVDDEASVSETTKEVIKNRREYLQLYTDVKKDGYKFYGWTRGERYAPDSLTDLTIGLAGYTMSKGYTKEEEEEYDKNGDLIYLEEHYYPYFVSLQDKTATIEYHLVNGGDLPGINKEDGKYIEVVNTNVDRTWDRYYEKVGFVPGYTFVGFYLDSECKTDVQYRLSSAYLDSHAGKKIDVYVKFTKLNYNLTYYVEGGVMTGRTLLENDTIFKTTFDIRNDVMLCTNMIKEGHTFGGWYTERNGQGNKVEKIGKGTEKDVEVYAYWKKNNFNVTYVLHGGTVNGKPKDSYTVTLDRTKENVLETNVTYEEHDFVGWFTEEGGRGTQYTVIPASEDEIEDLTLHAAYKDTTYTVTYVLDGGVIKGKKLNESGNVVEKYSNKKAVNLYTREDVAYESGVFTHWVDETGKPRNSIPANHEGNIVLRAQYSTETYDITYNISENGIADGIFVNNGKFKQTYNKALSITLPTDVRRKETRTLKNKVYDLYIFDGWYTNGNYTGSSITTIPEGNPQDIKELYAKWTRIEYGIVFYLNGGKADGYYRNEKADISTTIAFLGEEFELPTIVTKDFYEFEGWYDNEKFNGKAITKLDARPSQLKNGGVSLYAKFKQTKYKMTYVAEVKEGGMYRMGTLITKIENKAPYVLHDETKDFLKNVIKTDYGFDGWYRKNGDEFVGDEVVYLDANVTTEQTVYAKLVKLSTLGEEEKAAFDARNSARIAKRKEGEEKREAAFKKEGENAGNQVTNNIRPGEDGFYNTLREQLINEDRKVASQAKNEELNASKTSALGELFATVKDVLLGDDPTPKPATSNEVTVSIKGLLAYDTVSEKKLGVSAPKGTYLDSIIITYIKDAAGNFVDDYSVIGRVLLAGENFADIADAYPGHTLGARAIFVDNSIVTPPSSPTKRPTYYGGGTTGGGGGGGGGGGVGGALPAANNTIIVNPYGYDGRGKDNGALRAGILKLHVNSKIGRIATPSFGDYKTINMSAGSSSLMGLSDETWEYFPASNEFKLFMSAPNGDRYYLTNGWHKRVVNSKNMWYRFDNDGIMQRGFVEEGGNVYYLNNALSEFAYMVTGFKDFEGTGYTGYFRNDGVLVAIFPVAERAAYESKLVALPDKPNFDRSIYEKCRSFDNNRTRIVKSVKTYGQSVMGNFVGYWYYMASGSRKLRFETINTELQIARFANNGWINAYDTDNKLHSYRFDDATNLLVNTITPEGYIVGESGQMSGKNILLDFATIDVTKESGYVLAVTTLNTLPTNSRKLQSHLVTLNGVPTLDSPATDIWTVIDFQGVEPVLTNMVYGGSSIQPVVPQVQPLQLLSNAANAISSTFGLTQTEETIPIIDAVGIINPNSIVKITKVLSNVDFEQGAKLASEIVSSNNITSVYSLCMNIYNTFKELFAA